MANPRRTAVNTASGSFTLGPLGAAKNLAALPTQTVYPGTLSARVYWSVYTNLFTLTGKWQGSNDGGTTYRDILPIQNPTHVVLQTSTGTGAKYIEAPTCIAGFTHVRFSLVSGGASGTVGDTYSMSYNYVGRGAFDSPGIGGTY